MNTGLGQRSRQASWGRVGWVVVIAGLLGVLWPVPSPVAAGQVAVNSIERVSVANNGDQLLGGRFVPAMVSADGNVVGFNTKQGALVEGDTNDDWDGFLRVRSDQSTVRVTLGPDGSELSDPRLADVSATGRFVLFGTSDLSLVADDSEGTTDLFLKDLETGEVELINVSSSGEKGDGRSGVGRVSADGNIVAFVAKDLDAEDPVDDRAGLYVRDRQTGVTTLIKTRVGLVEFSGRNPSITPDGRYVAFEGFGYVYRYDTVTGDVDLVSTSPLGDGGPEAGNDPDITADGRYVTYRSTVDRVDRVLLRDMDSPEPPQLITVNAAGRESSGRSPSISDDGRYIAFASGASDLGPLVPEGSRAQVYVFDRETNTMRLVSVNAAGELSNGTGPELAISGDGSTVVFSTSADNLVLGDTNSTTDIFAVDLATMESGCGGHPVTIFGSGEIFGTDGDDVIQGSPGDDVINAGAGNDIICADGGDDVIDGGPGDDQIYANNGDDQVTAGPGSDRVYGGKGDDRIRGGDNIDMIYGGKGNDFVHGDTGDDILGGGPGDDRVIGGPGADSLGGGEDNDLCRGSAGRDRYFQCETKQK